MMKTKVSQHALRNFLSYRSTYLKTFLKKSSFRVNIQTNSNEFETNSRHHLELVSNSRRLRVGIEMRDGWLLVGKLGICTTTFS